MSLELDMSKAYDCMSSNCLELVIIKIGMNREMVELIMYYVKSVSFFILINGESHSDLTLSRSIRQGDPLSHFLFLFYTEGLIALLKNVEENMVLTRVKICHQAPPFCEK